MSLELSDKEKESILSRMERAVADAEIQLKEFDRMRSSIIGDEYLSKMISSLDQNDFLTPENAVYLSNHYLHCVNDGEIKSKEDGAYTIRLGKIMREKLDSFSRKLGNEEGYSELRPLLDSDGVINVVFDGSITNEHPDCLLLPPTGYWMRFVASELEVILRKTFSVRVHGGDIGLKEGNYLLFMFETRFEGIKTESAITNVLVNLKSNETNIREIDWNKQELQNADYPRNVLNGDQIDSALNVARDALETKLNTQKSEIESELRYKNEIRINALSNSSKIKTKKLYQQMEDHKKARGNESRQVDDDFLRMTSARIEKETERLASRLELIRKNCSASYYYNLEAVAFVDVG